MPPIFESTLASLSQVCQLCLSKALPLALSFADDLLLVIFSKLGIPLPGLAWIAPVLMTATVLYWTIRLVRYLWKRYTYHYSNSL